MTPEQLYYFMGRCLTLDEVPDRVEPIRQTLSREDFPWKPFVWMGSAHLILPALYVKFRNSSLLDALPVDLADHLGHLHALSADRNRQLMEQLNWLHALLKLHGIGHLYLKGAAALTNGLYADTGERVLSDIDCLIREEEMERAVKLLKSGGYSARRFHASSLPLMHHYPSLFKPGQPAQIELHKIPVGRRQLKYLSPGILDGSLLQSAQTDGQFTLPPADQILISVIHSQLKDRGQYYGVVPLRSAYEFYRLTLRHDPADVEIHHPRMRIVYDNFMAVANRVFHPEQPYPVRNEWRTRLFLYRFHLNRTNRTYHRFSTYSRSFADLLASYAYVIGFAIRNRSFRKSFLTRLITPAWYRHHLGVIRKRFSFNAQRATPSFTSRD